jgi:transcriptional regulator with XRE-family HTH domain
LYQNFLKLIEKKGITPYRVAKDTGIATATLTAWKNGDYIPKLDKIQKIADYLGVTLDELIKE